MPYFLAIVLVCHMSFNRCTMIQSHVGFADADACRTAVSLKVKETQERVFAETGADEKNYPKMFVFGLCTISFGPRVKA